MECSYLWEVLWIEFCVAALDSSAAMTLLLTCGWSVKELSCQYLSTDVKLPGNKVMIIGGQPEMQQFSNKVYIGSYEYL